MDAGSELRRRLEAFGAAEARARIARYHAVDGPADRDGLARWLSGEGAAEALAEAEDSGELSDVACGAVQERLREVTALWALEPARKAMRRPQDVGAGPRPLAVLSGELTGRPAVGAAKAMVERCVRAASSLAPVLDEARAAASGVLPADRDLQASGGWLDGTDGLAEELASVAMRTVRGGCEPWVALLRGVRAVELDGWAEPRRRWKRLAQGLSVMGFERDLTRGMRAERAHQGPLLEVRICAPALPGDVRMSPSGLEAGVLSELEAAVGLGRGLALSLVSPALPVEQRRADGWGVPWALGNLYGQLLADPLFLTKVHGLSRRDAASVAAAFGRAVLFRARAAVALAVAGHSGARRSERMEVAAQALLRALQVEVPPPVAFLCLQSAARQQQRAAGCLAGLGLHVALRERFDEDWFRNPRVQDVVRGACARGAGLALGALCEELGLQPTYAVQRVFELTERA